MQTMNTDIPYIENKQFPNNKRQQLNSDGDVMQQFRSATHQMTLQRSSKATSSGANRFLKNSRTHIMAHTLIRIFVFYQTHTHTNTLGHPIRSYPHSSLVRAPLFIASREKEREAPNGLQLFPQLLNASVSVSSIYIWCI